ncbi:MAG: hypothetical protein ACR2IV_13055 [Bryobacteraceae bacterium]
MTNSSNAGARVHVTAEYLSENEPFELLRFHYAKSSRNRIIAPGEGRHMRMPTLNEIESQTDQGGGNRIEKPYKIIGQKSDKAKSKLLNRELLNCEGKVTAKPKFAGSIPARASQVLPSEHLTFISRRKGKGLLTPAHGHCLVSPLPRTNRTCFGSSAMAFH